MLKHKQQQYCVLSFKRTTFNAVSLSPKGKSKRPKKSDMNTAHLCVCVVVFMVLCVCVCVVCTY